MHDFVNRLGLLLKMMELGEYDLLKPQAEKLRTDTDDERVEAIIEAIEARDYLRFVELIEACLPADGLVVYQDPDLFKIRVEEKALRQQLGELLEQKGEMERQINLFGIRYQKALGALIGELFRLRKKKLRREADKDPSRQKDYEEATSDYERHRQEFKAKIKDEPQDLSEEQQRELKRYYRDAAKIYHPDVLPDAMKEEGAEKFKALNNAYKLNDLAQVKAIYEAAKQSGVMGRVSKMLSDKVKLKAEISRLSIKLELVQKEVAAIKRSTTYMTLSEYDDWEDYFTLMKEQLTFEIESLGGVVP